MLQTKAGRRILHGVVLGVLLLNLAIGAKVYSESDANSTVNDPHANLDLFVNVLERVRRDYVDGGEWTYEELAEFLYKPKKFVKGTKMNFAGLKKVQDRANIVLFLREQAENPVPLP